MEPKRISSKTGVKKKGPRRLLTVPMKLDIISRLENGERPKDVCESLKLPSSTVRTIYLQRNRLKKYANNYSVLNNVSIAQSVVKRPDYMETLDNLLVTWMNDNQDAEMTFPIIREKALSLYEKLKEEAGDEGKYYDFKASAAWYKRFKTRLDIVKSGDSNVKNIEIPIPVVQTENPNKKVIDMSAVKKFPGLLQKIIREGGYTPKQIFNIDETGLFWKKLPSKTSIAVKERYLAGPKTSNDRLTLLLGTNLEGDVKLKPLMVYHSQRPRALKNLNKASLPVIWTHNKKAWVTMEIFADYIADYFSPFVSVYCDKNNLNNKALLIIDSAPGHPPNIEDFADNVQVVFLPPNTSSVLQPMNNGVKMIFKAYYHELVMSHFYNPIDSEQKMSKEESWKNYNIRMAMDYIVFAWNKINFKILNGCWESLFPKYVNYHQNFGNFIKGIQHTIVKLAHDAGFADVDYEDVEQLLCSHSVKLTDEEIQQIFEELNEQNDINEKDGESLKKLDIDTLADFLDRCEKAVKIVEDNDPQMERVVMFKFKMNEALECYRNLYKKKLASQSWGKITGQPHNFTDTQNISTSENPLDSDNFDLENDLDVTDGLNVDMFNVKVEMLEEE